MRILRTISAIITIFLLLVCLFLGFIYYCNTQNIEVPAIGSFKMYVVLSPSMEPKIRINDVVIIGKANPNNLQPGDIITFTAFEANAVITHRITAKTLTANGYEFKTKGDSNNIEDPFVTPQDRIIGKYLVCIPQLAALLDFTTKKPYMIAVLVVIILFIQFLCGVAERKLQPVIPKTAATSGTAGAKAPQLNEENRTDVEGQATKEEK